MIFFGLTILELILLIFSPLILLGLLVNDKYGWATLVTLLTGGLLAWNNWAEITAFFSGEGAVGNTAVAVFIYVGIGLVVSLLKWFFYVRKKTRSFYQYIHVGGNGTLEECLLNFVKNQYDGKKDLQLGIIKFQVKADKVKDENDEFSQSKSKVFTNPRFDWDYDSGDLAEAIAAWTTWWPFFLVLVVFEDFLARFFDLIVDLFGNAYNHIGTWAVGSVKPKVK
jgi:hypothetical protein